MKKLKEDIRPGATMSCPSCGKLFKYAVMTNHDAPTPFFYSNQGHSVLLRRSDEQVVMQRMAAGATGVDQLEMLWQKFLESAPPGPDGGVFTFWANVRCPHCKHEFPYNNGVKNLAMRIFEPKIILVDGSVVLGDSDADSYIVRVATNSHL
jgi:hypothetical protein